MVIDAASYLVSTIPFRRLPADADRVERHHRGPAGDGPSSFRSEVGEGYAFLRHHPILWRVTVATMVYFLGAAAGLSLLVLLIVDTAGAPTWAFGVVLACGAAGAFTGTLIGATLSTRFGVCRTLATAMLVEGAALAAMALSTAPPMLAMVWFVGGIPAGVRTPVGRSLQQRLTPNRLLGRVNVTSRMFTRGVIVVGAVGAGALAAAIGVRATFVVGGGVVILASLLMSAALRGVDHDPLRA